MFVIVKGSATEATAAAVRRGIDLRVLLASMPHETHFDVADSHHEKVAAWFCEPPMEPPFDAGTCLYYVCPRKVG